MNNLVKFENTSIEVQVINGVPMFELYAVGMALGQIVNAKGKVYANKKRIDQNVKTAEIQVVLRNAKPYITESQIYDLMLETRTDKCRAFRKWLTNEVLPELNKNGSYSIPKKEDKQLELYNYEKMTYNGESVMTLADVVHFTGLSRYEIQKVLRDKGCVLMDYYLLEGKMLREFKKENQSISKLASVLFVITKSGFDLVCKEYGIKTEPDNQKLCSSETKKKKEYAVVIGNRKIEATIEAIRKELTTVDVLLTKFYRHNISVDDMNALKTTINEVSLELSADVFGLTQCKFAVTDSYKY